MHKGVTPFTSKSLRAKAEKAFFAKDFDICEGHLIQLKALAFESCTNDRVGILAFCAEMYSRIAIADEKSNEASYFQVIGECLEA